MKKKIAIYPGSFDPLTTGHEEIIKKASKLFDEVYVVIGENISKTPLFNDEERLAMLNKVIAKYPNVKADIHKGASLEYATKIGAVAMIRGIRNAKDFDAEISQYFFNHNINKEIETVVLLPDVQSLFISSSAIKELATIKADYSRFVPQEIYEEIHNKLK